MKKLFFLILIVFFNKTTQSQCLDTFSYLKSFEIQKNLYIGQTFSFLLNNMTSIQPKSSWSGRNIKNKNEITYSTFFFDVPHKTTNNGVIGLVIHWQVPILASEIADLESINHNFFSQSVRDFYNNRIIKDIIVYR